MYGLKALIGATTLLAGLALVPAAHAQVVIDIGVPPVCSYGYYDYQPYACAPMGFYGTGYFYDGIFLGMGPWAGWGYGHGWGSHRFVNDGGGSYHGGGGLAANRGYQTNRARWAGGSAGGANVHTVSRTSTRNTVNTRNNSGAARPSAAHAAPARSHTAARASTQSHTAARTPTQSHAASRPGGGGSHAGGAAKEAPKK